MDEQFDALSDPHRRRLLVALLDHNPRDDVQVPDDLQDGDVSVEELRSKMFHTHLPKLEDEGFIRWDQDAHQVVKGPRFDEIRPLLELIDDHADELPEDWP